MSTKGAGKTPAASQIASPIEIRSTDAAFLYAHVHPALLLAGYLVQFPFIVANPVTGLARGLIPLSALQITYVITCLPVAGTGSSTTPPKSGQRAKIVAKRDALNLGDRIVVSLEAPSN